MIMHRVQHEPTDSDSPAITFRGGRAQAPSAHTDHHPLVARAGAMATGFNVSSVIARRYPEHSPWDIEFAVYRLWPAGKFLSCNSLSDAFKQGALAQAQATGVNPFHFVCMNNPFAFDRSGASGGDLEDGIEPLQSPPGLDDVLPLQRHEDLDVATLNVCDEVYTADEYVVVRVSVGDEVRLLKLVSQPSFVDAAQAHSQCNLLVPRDGC